MERHLGTGQGMAIATRKDRAEGPDEPPSYYGLPLLKPPAWKWEIASYFYLGGVSSGALLLARAARRFGGAAGRSLSQAGTFVAAGAFLPCPLLLIKDLGDPARFYYMLRIFKLRSPMSMGSFTLGAYSLPLGLATLESWFANDKRLPIADLTIDLLAAPLGLLMASYGGVLLSNTATPLWSKNRWLAPLFATSALHGAAAACSLYCHLRPHQPEPPRALYRFGRLGRLLSALSLIAYLGTAGRRSQPLVSGNYAPLFWAGGIGAGLLAPAVLERAAENTTERKNPWRRLLRLAASVADLIGGLALRWAVVYGGRRSARRAMPAS